MPSLVPTTTMESGHTVLPRIETARLTGMRIGFESIKEPALSKNRTKPMTEDTIAGFSKTALG